MKKQCANCHFFRKSDSRCLCFPPTYNSDYNKYLQLQVGFNDWCGQFQVKKSKSDN